MPFCLCPFIHRCTVVVSVEEKMGRDTSVSETCNVLCQIRFKLGWMSPGRLLETQSVLYSLVCFKFQALLYFTGELLVPGNITLSAGAAKPKGNLLSLFLFSSFFFPRQSSRNKVVLQHIRNSPGW